MSYKMSRKRRLPNTFCIVLDNREGIGTAASANKKEPGVIYFIYSYFSSRIVVPAQILIILKKSKLL